VMEVGDVDRVIKKPQHPYTRLLIDSIPWPELNRRWGETEIIAREADIREVGEGCKFYGRCPFAVEKCEVFPPLFKLNEQQAVSCFLFDENPQIASENISELMPI
ncbi:MAG: oligopeptide/dipeptide ABC transporter ATP-binding protein, partial [Anaerolineales bacterium]